MWYSKPITEIIPRRYSCRAYLDRPIEQAVQKALTEFMASLAGGPLGATARFALVAATEQDRTSLRGLGTYGFIKGATGFIIGAVRSAPGDLEDYGYLMERIILLATDLGLGTCWLGGSFTRSSFARKIGAGADEMVPAVAAIGYPVDDNRARDWIRRSARSDSRLPWEKLFFSQSFARPLTREEAGVYATPLEMVRLAPSASNRQPWRMVRDSAAWHLYMWRTKGYRDNLVSRVLGIADLQRIDMGIAMCHLELTATELGLPGRWVVQEPPIEKPSELVEYIASWTD